MASILSRPQCVNKKNIMPHPGNKLSIRTGNIMDWHLANHQHSSTQVRVSNQWGSQLARKCQGAHSEQFINLHRKQIKSFYKGILPLYFHKNVTYMTYIYSKWDDDACRYYLTHWGWVTLICVSKITIIGSDNGLSPGRRQAIIWTRVGILLIGPLGTNFSEILIEIYTFSLKKRHLEMSSGKIAAILSQPQWVKAYCFTLYDYLYTKHPPFPTSKEASKTV